MDKHIKKLIIVFLCVLTAVLCAFAVAACNTKEEPYYGTYYCGYREGEEPNKIVIGKTYKDSGGEYNYDYENGVMYVNGVKVVFAENFEVHYIAEAKIWSYGNGAGSSSINVRNGYFNDSLYVLDALLVMQERYNFMSDGSYEHYKFDDDMLPDIERGTYTLNSGVLTLNQTSYTAGLLTNDQKTHRYWYISEDLDIYGGAYLKHPDKFTKMPDTPDTPDIPDMPDTPDVPDTPDTPSKPSEQKFTLSYSAGAGGRIIGSLTQSVESGKNGDSVLAVPDEGYEFIGWSDGVETAERQDTNVTEDVTATAQFGLKTYSVTYTAAAGGSITGTLSQTVEHGKNGASVLAVPDEGYVFIGWSDGVATAERQDTNVTEDVTATAQFGLKTYSVTYTAAVGGSITGTLSQTVEHGKNGASVLAVPDEGYEFIGWSDGVATAERQDTNVIEDIAVKAQFRIAIVPEAFETGDGTVNNPYMVSTVNQLANVEKYPTSHYMLQNDIVFKTVESGDYNFKPLFSDDNMFNGVFDGNGHKITNLTINNTSTFYTGLFACIGEKGAVKNLTLENVNISGTNYIGGIAGYSLGVIENCSVGGSINYLSHNGYKVFIGGIVGRMENLIGQCNTEVSITCIEAKGGTNIGGVAGYLSGGVSFNPFNISECSTTGDIVCDKTSSTVYVGGVFGYTEERIKFARLSSTGELTVTNSSGEVYCGGLAGVFGDSCDIYDSFTTGNINANGEDVSCGGFGGRIYRCTISNSYTTGNVTANGREVRCGGFGGDYGNGSNTIISNSYTAGNVTANGRGLVYCGGFIGYSSCFQDIFNSYTMGNVTANGREVYCGGFGGYIGGDDLAISSSYTVSKISVSCEGENYSGAFVGSADTFKLTNAHWLYFADSGVEYAVDYGSSMGIPSSIGAIKHTQLSDFYTLAETLNNGLEEPVWENLGENALPTFKKKAEGQN